jgi:uncharacterized protein
VTTLFLTPGSGNNADHSSLVAIERALSPMPVVRHRFPYEKAPVRAPKLLADIVEATAGLDRPLVLGGRSMGGRMCSMAVADSLVAGAAGLVLICYPLHPPGRPENLRTEHLPRITVPCLFLSGTKDPFGRPDELEAASALIPADVEHVWFEGKGHDTRGCDDRIAEAVTAWVRRRGLPG